LEEKNIQAIDVHGHFGKYVNGKFELIKKFMSADAEEVARRARIAHTKLTIVSSMQAITPKSKGDILKSNIDAEHIVSKTDGLLLYAVVNPTNHGSYDQAIELLKRPKCVGIKIHPEEHNYPIAKYGQAIFEFAAKYNIVISTHSGDKRSMPEDFVRFANDFSSVKLILGHLGWGGGSGNIDYQVRAIQSSKHGNMFVDTSSSQSIIPNLIEWAVSEIGAERILYGTDTPCYFAPMQRARIDYADITEQDKKLLLHDNAAKLFGLTKGL